MTTELDTISKRTKPMKLFTAKRIDSIGYDEYDELLVRAEDETAARKIALGYDEHGASFLGFAHDNFEVTEVTADGEPGVIVSSFNAG